MTAADYAVIVASLAFFLAAGFLFSRRAGRSVDEFILGGRRLPWWLAGLAMVGTSNSIDSALHQSGKIRRDGLPGAWFYWSQIIGQCFATIVISRYWRRSGLTTIVELYELRYSGPAARLGRAWGMFQTAFVEGTVILAIALLAMIKICGVLLDITGPLSLLGWSLPPEIVIALAGVALAAAYSSASGLLGVVAGDLLECLFALLCGWLLAAAAYAAVGGPAGLELGLAELGRAEALSLSPALGISFLALFLFQPLVGAGGGRGEAQRCLAVRTEQEAVLASATRMCVHFFLRSWPWLLTALCSLVLLAGRDLAAELAYPTLIRELLPAGLRGLMFAGFLVAFMSSVGALMHNGGSVFVNDLYRPRLAPGRTDRHYVRVARIAIVVLTAVATFVALAAEQILGLVQFMLKLVAAGGIIGLLRWFWWRVNAWADVSAQFIAFPVTLFYEHGAALFGPGRDPVARLASLFGPTSPDDIYGASFLLTVGTTTLLALGVMFLTPPEPAATLRGFYARVRPFGAWGPVARDCPEVTVTDRPGRDFAHAATLLALLLGLLFGLGGLVLARWTLAAGGLATAAVAAFALGRALRPDHPASAPASP